MSHDLLYNYRNVNKLPNYEFDDIFNETLRIIEDNLRSLDLFLESYEGMPTCPPGTFFFLLDQKRMFTRYKFRKKQHND